MVVADRHAVRVNGVGLNGVAQPRPVLLQMIDDDFPARFLRDLATPGQAPLPTAKNAVTASTSTPPALFQPVQRVVNVAMTQLTCDSVGSPRLDPTRVIAAGIVIRRIGRDAAGRDQPGLPPSAWMRSASGQYQWVKLDRSQEDQDPDPAKRPVMQTGQAALDRLLAAHLASSTWTEISTPAFAAAPEIGESTGRTVLYGVIPTASSEVSDTPPAAPQYDANVLAGSLPMLLKAGSHHAPQAGRTVDYRFLSDDFATGQGATDFLTFSAALRLLHSVFGAFEDTAEAAALRSALNRRHVTFVTGLNVVRLPMGNYYEDAARALIDYDPYSGQPAPNLRMPNSWDAFSQADQDAVVAAVISILRVRSAKVLAPRGRFQDATRLYRLRMFFRVKADSPRCPPDLVWSEYSDLFRIAAWYESDGSGRALPPVPLPDPTQRGFLKNAKPNCSFAVPAGLMNAIQGAGMSKLIKGESGGGGVNLNWICGFNIPLITICAFFVLNIFLSMLNIVFFWLPFIKICIPFPVPAPGANSGDD